MISRIVLKLRTPYLTPEQRGEIENYLATARARRAALEEVRRVIVRVADNVIQRMRVAYPQFVKFHVQGYEKTHRDITLLTGLATNAMFLGEHDTIDEMFTEWFRTIMKAVHLSPQVLRDVYTAWQEELRALLSEDAFALLQPHTEHIASYLTNVPVPVRDETGERRPFPQPIGAAP